MPFPFQTTDYYKEGKERGQWSMKPKWHALPITPQIKSSTLKLLKFISLLGIVIPHAVISRYFLTQELPF